MAYGVIPLASTVSCIPQYLEKFRTGRAFDAYDGGAFVGAIEWYRANGLEWKNEAVRAMESARLFSYVKYLTAVRRLLSFDGAGVSDESLRPDHGASRKAQ